MGFTESATTAAGPPPRKIKPLLWIGIFLMPYIFAWFTLRRGYGQAARFISFAWLVALLAIFAFGSDKQAPASGDNRSLSQVATDTMVNPQMNAITDKVARDSVDQYNMARTGGDKIEICVHAGMVAAAYLQAKDQANYLLWKGNERTDCAAAGMPKHD